MMQVAFRMRAIDKDLTGRNGMLTCQGAEL